MSDGERLQRYLARCGVASRRRAEELIGAGRVSVDGHVITEYGTKVTAASIVEVDGQRVTPAEDHVYYILNKPPGYITTLDDPQGRRTVAELFPEDGRRLFAVGRLDRDTTGLLLLTDDGDLAHRLMHPRFHVAKTYVARVGGHPTEATLEKLRHGIRLDDGPTKPAEVERVAFGDRWSDVRITLREGRKRQVRRMFAAVGHPVNALHRASFGPVEVGDLPEGQTRLLSDEEATALRAAVQAGVDA